MRAYRYSTPISLIGEPVRLVKNIPIQILGKLSTIRAGNSIPSELKFLFQEYLEVILRIRRLPKSSEIRIVRGYTLRSKNHLGDFSVANTEHDYHSGVPLGHLYKSWTIIEHAHLDSEIEFDSTCDGGFMPIFPERQNRIDSMQCVFFIMNESSIGLEQVSNGYKISRHTSICKTMDNIEIFIFSPCITGTDTEKVSSL